MGTKVESNHHKITTELRKLIEAYGDSEFDIGHARGNGYDHKDTKDIEKIRDTLIREIDEIITQIEDRGDKFLELLKTALSFVDDGIIETEGHWYYEVSGEVFVRGDDLV